MFSLGNFSEMVLLISTLNLSKISSMTGLESNIGPQLSKEH